MSKASNISAIDYISESLISAFNKQTKPNDEQRLVFMFHGYGADNSDLVGLKDVLVSDEESAKWSWVFPQGIETVDIGGGWKGRAWWPITLSQLPGDWSEVSPPGIDVLRQNALNSVDNYRQMYKLSWSQIVFGGFSQGAMLATELYLHAPEQPAGLLSFSGTLIRKGIWADRLSARQGASLFLSHGEQDTVLPVKGSHALNNLFRQNGLKTQFCTFPGGHEIPMKAIDKAKHYLHNLV